MRKLTFLSLIAAAVVFFGVQAHAQETPHWEFFGGYGFEHVESGKEVVPVDQFGTFPNVPFAIDLGQNLNGFHGSIEENVNSWFGGVADVGGGFTSTTINYTSVNGPKVLTNHSFFTYQFGPQFSLRKFAPVTLFAHALAGGVDNRVNFSTGTAAHNTNSWSVDFGGGVDVRITNHLAIRVLQADWFRSYLAQSLTSDSQDNWSASAGLVLRIGQR